MNSTVAADEQVGGLDIRVFDAHVLVQLDQPGEQLAGHVAQLIGGQQSLQGRHIPALGELEQAEGGLAGPAHAPAALAEHEAREVL